MENREHRNIAPNVSPIERRSFDDDQNGKDAKNTNVFEDKEAGKLKDRNTLSKSDPKDSEGGNGNKFKADKSEKSHRAEGIISPADGINDSSRMLIVDREEHRIRNKLPPTSSSKTKVLSVGVQGTTTLEQLSNDRGGSLASPASTATNNTAKEKQIAFSPPCKTKVLSVGVQGTTTLEQLSNDRGGSLASPASTATNNTAKEKQIASSPPYRKRNRCSDVRVPDTTTLSSIAKQIQATKKRARQSKVIKFTPGTNISEIPLKENKNKDTTNLTSGLTPAQKVKWSNLPPPIWDDINRAKTEWRTFQPGNQDCAYIPPSLNGIDKTKVHKLGTVGIHFALGNEGLIKMICQFGPKHAPIFPMDTITTITSGNNKKSNSKGKILRTSKNSKIKKKKKKALSSSTSIVRYSEVHTPSHNHKPNLFETIEDVSIEGPREIIDADGTENKANKIMDSDMKSSIDNEQYSDVDYSAFHDQNPFEAAISVSSPCASLFNTYDKKASAGPNLNICSGGKARRRPFEVTIKAGPKIYHSQTLIYSSDENIYDVSVYDAIQRAYWMQKARFVFLHDGARKGKLMHLKYTNVNEKSVGIISSNRWHDINIGELREVVQKNAILLEVELVDKSEF